MTPLETVLAQALADCQGQNQALRQQLATANARIAELEGLTPPPLDSGASHI